MKKPFMSVYTKKNLGPRGNPGQWRQAFGQRMGLPAANQRARAGKWTARGILGLDEDERDWEVIKKAYRRLAVECYPEMRGGVWHGDKEKYLDVQAAYEILERWFGK